MTQISHVMGRTDLPLIEKTIGQIFDDISEQHASVTALVSCHQNIRLTYRQLRNRVDALAVGLLRLGIQVGDRVGIWAPNREEWVLTQFATAEIADHGHIVTGLER